MSQTDFLPNLFPVGVSKNTLIFPGMAESAATK